MRIGRGGGLAGAVGMVGGAHGGGFLCAAGTGTRRAAGDSGDALAGDPEGTRAAAAEAAPGGAGLRLRDGFRAAAGDVGADFVPNPTAAGNPGGTSGISPLGGRADRFSA